MKSEKHILRSLGCLLVLVLALAGCTASTRPPTGDWFGQLSLSGINYRLCFNLDHHPPLLNVTFRAREIALDTLYFQNDSLHFRLKEFYSEYSGRFDREKKTIDGFWTGEDSARYPLNFVPALTDTILGLHPKNTPTYTYEKPQLLDDGLATCALPDQSVDKEWTDSLIHEIMREKYPNIHSMLISRNNCLVVEEYFYAFRSDMHFGIQSATKSFVSALTGIALQKGQIASLQDPLCKYFKGYEDLTCNAQNKTITLRQVLTMNTGLAWDEVTYDYTDDRNSNAIAYRQPDAYRYLLAQPRSNASQFNYNSYNHLMMNHVLKNATKLENIDALESQLLHPLGFSGYDLGKPEKGVIYDIFLRPRDMLKFGLLYLNDGMWKGKQLVPASWVKESTTAQIDVKPGLGYGYFWWTTEFEKQGRKVKSFFAWGYGGQYIFVVPELKLVTVFSGSNWSTDPEGFYFEIMEKYIVKACQQQTAF